MASLDELARLVRWEGPGVQGVDWPALDTELGVSLPSEFKDYVARFPKGEYQTYLNIVQPYSASDLPRYLEDVQMHTRVLQAAAHDTAFLPYDVYPNVPGLFPWGYIGTDEVFTWRLQPDDQGSPPIAIVDIVEGSCETLQITMVDLLVDIIDGRVPRYRWLADECVPPRFVEYRSRDEPNGP